MTFGKPKKPRAPLNASGLYDYAVRALGRSMRTEVELKRLMKQRAEEGDLGEAAITAVLTKLREQGYVNDAAFAETYGAFVPTDPASAPQLPGAARAAIVAVTCAGGIREHILPHFCSTGSTGLWGTRALTSSRSWGRGSCCATARASAHLTRRRHAHELREEDQPVDK